LRGSTKATSKPTNGTSSNTWCADISSKEARLQARGATWKGSGRPCTLEFKFDPKSNSSAEYGEQVTRKVTGTEDRHSQPDPTPLSTSSECAKPSVKSRRNFEKEKLSESSRSTEPAVDNTRPRLQREGSRRKRKAVTDQERRSPETQLSTVVATRETDYIEQPSSRKRKSKLAMKNKETILGTDETGTEPRARKPKQCVITRRSYNPTKIIKQAGSRCHRRKTALPRSALVQATKAYKICSG
jgi:hypothetical protein